MKRRMRAILFVSLDILHIHLLTNIKLHHTGNNSFVKYSIIVLYMIIVIEKCRGEVEGEKGKGEEVDRGDRIR